MDFSPEQKFAAQLLIGLVLAFLAAWLGAAFALRRFYKEKIWERKINAYFALIEAAHHMRIYYDRNLEAHMDGRELTDEYKGELDRKYDQARVELQKQISFGDLIISSAAVAAIEEMFSQLKYDGADWIGYLDHGVGVTQNCLVALKTAVATELRLDPHKYWTLRRKVI